MYKVHALLKIIKQLLALMSLWKRIHKIVVIKVHALVIIIKQLLVLMNVQKKNLHKTVAIKYQC